MKLLIFFIAIFSAHLSANVCPNFKGTYFLKCPTSQGQPSQHLIVHQNECRTLGLQMRKFKIGPSPELSGWSGNVDWILMESNDILIYESSVDNTKVNTVVDQDSLFINQVRTAKKDGRIINSYRRKLDLDPDGNLYINSEFYINEKNCSN